ncbi:MAG TPA: hypothetical protein DCQ64_06825 [Candidatus Rokubacteria bacterium]|nr:hypothetical protein [Candidatus Rokubacteria bacterium]
MPLTVCASPQHLDHPVMHDQGEDCPICTLVNDLRADVARYRDRCDHYGAILAGIRAAMDHAALLAPLPGTAAPIPAVDEIAAEPADTIPEPIPVEPTFPPAAESKTKAAEILNRLPIDTRITLYRAAGIDPGKGVATWRGRPQAAHELLVACQKAEAALTPATAPYTDTDDSDTDPGEGEPVDTNGADDHAPAPPADPERDMAMRRRAVVLRALPYAELRNLHHAATGTLASVSTPSEELIQDVLDHEFSAAEPAAADPDNEVPF